MLGIIDQGGTDNQKGVQMESEALNSQCCLGCKRYVVPETLVLEDMDKDIKIVLKICPYCREVLNWPQRDEKADD